MHQDPNTPSAPHNCPVCGEPARLPNLGPILCASRECVFYDPHTETYHILALPDDETGVEFQIVIEREAVLFRPRRWEDAGRFAKFADLCSRALSPFGKCSTKRKGYDEAVRVTFTPYRGREQTCCDVSLYALALTDCPVERIAADTCRSILIAHMNHALTGSH